MRLTLIRDKAVGEHTPGEIFYEGKHICYTCEDLVRPVKIPGMTAIPHGIYPLVLTMSKRFKKVLPLLLNVPNYSGVRIHGGNTAEDTEGCILPGLDRTATGVARSQDAMKILMPLIGAAIDRSEPVEIEII